MGIDVESATARDGADSPMPAWTGARGGRTSAARWGRPSRTRRSGGNGWPRTSTAGPSRSRGSAVARWPVGSAFRFERGRRRGMKVLVTGVRGKVGTATAKAPCEAGHAVTGTDLMRGRLRAACSRGAGLRPGRPDPARRRVRRRAGDGRRRARRRHSRSRPTTRPRRSSRTTSWRRSTPSRPRSASGSRDS